ncbi:hypothetical protein [Pannus brasiliensis]|uniref:hypothetical protein n=1 Tax=Pannus brasiliensis TaxID=1579216 RepID=UPI002FCDCAA6
MAAELLNDFPNNLPKDLKNPISKNYLALSSSLLKAAKQAENTEAVSKELDELEPWDNDNVLETNEKGVELEPSEKQKIEILTSSRAEKLAIYAIDLVISANLDKLKENEALDIFGSFTPLSMYQAVAMHFAHLDAFLSDTIRVMCKSDPELLKKRNKQVLLNTVLKFSDLQDVITHFNEELVYELSWRKTIKERFKSLKDYFKLEFNIPEEEERILEIFERKRHIIIHNGGLIDSGYVKHTKHIDSQTEKVGELLAISLKDIEDLYRAVKMSGSSIFTAVACQYLDANENQLTQVWRRSKDQQNQPE